MTLYEACEIGYTCGLTTIGECIDNVYIHQYNLFDYDDAYFELQELFKEVKHQHCKNEDSVETILGKDKMAEIDDNLIEDILFL